MRFNKIKCSRVWHLKRENYMHEYRLGDDLLQRSSAVKDLGVLLVDDSLAVSQAVCPCGQERQWYPGMLKRAWPAGQWR